MASTALADKLVGEHPTNDSTWRKLSLAAQFALAGSLIMLVGMAVIGVWVTRQIEVGVTRNTAAATSLYMTSFVEPLVQELSDRETLAPPNQIKLDNLIERTSLGQRIVSFKVWKQGGLIAYSSHKGTIGQRFEITPSLKRAWLGEVTAEFDSLEDDEDAAERAANIPLLEIYSPIRESGTGRIIAVAEFYETAPALKANLFRANLKSWLVVGVATLAMFGLLSGIVLRGSRTIDLQHTALEHRVNELSRLLAQNIELRARVQGASRRTAEINEQHLRRVGADLHDGPAQLLSLAALRLDSLKPLLAPSPEGLNTSGRTDIEVVGEALSEALSEIRNISAGLTLPALEELSPESLLRDAAKAHERRTKTMVDVDIQSTPDNLDMSMKICLYRFVQEALSNAFRHASGIGQRLTCQLDGEILEVAVSDSGPGFDKASKPKDLHGLGLRGLRERIESIGAELEIRSVPGQGTKLVLRCDIRA